MRQVALYSGLLIFGILVSQFIALDQIRTPLTAITMACLAYIMVEVGLEFSLDKRRLKSYGWDYIVAATAAAFPWIVCATYFVVLFQTPWKEALLIGRFAAPTSAGVLFAMLGAAGLGTTWLFRKVRILAIFDDLDTVLLMIPLQVMLVGFKPELAAVIAIIGLLLIVAYRWFHQVHLPVGRGWLLGYGVTIVGLCAVLEHTTNVHLEVLLPAFALGCLLHNPHDPLRPQERPHEHAHLEPESGGARALDRSVKALFMFLVGCSLPRIALQGRTAGTVLWHVVILTVLSNVGKCFPTLCYRREASLRERLAVSVAMFPRGEVGAGVLLVAIGYGLTGLPIVMGSLSLALNLLLTGVFIVAVIRLLAKRPVSGQTINPG